mmetsp:Transcript_11349/g.35002  ORF Transcript_11349/g.35002 Transcript_11349/m.35002 type:complete len:252 (+) Transcript_11349:1263-2018(+)
MPSSSCRSMPCWNALGPTFGKRPFSGRWTSATPFLAPSKPMSASSSATGKPSPSIASSPPLLPSKRGSFPPTRLKSSSPSTPHWASRAQSPGSPPRRTLPQPAACQNVPSHVPLWRLPRALAFIVGGLQCPRKLACWRPLPCRATGTSVLVTRSLCTATACCVPLSRPVSARASTSTRSPTRRLTLHSQDSRHLCAPTRRCCGTRPSPLMHPAPYESIGFSLNSLLEMLDAHPDTLRASVATVSSILSKLD